MMDESRALTTLAEIRALELEMARRLDDTRVEAAAAVADATRQARQTVVDARERGLRRAEAHHRERVAAAVAEAQQIHLTGQTDAADLLVELRPQLLGLVDAMLDVVLAPPTEEGG
jgi:vacuolar-type H+-ATPase subunit H